MRHGFAAASEPASPTGARHAAAAGLQRRAVAAACQECLRCARPALALSLSLLVAPQAMAQTTVAPGTNLSTLPAPVNGTVWNLQGDASLSSAPQAAFAMPLPVAGTVGINSIAPGGASTITLNDGAGHYGNFSSSGAAVLNLSGITFTGGNNSAAGTAGGGGAFNIAGALQLNATGALGFSANVAAENGGAIRAGTLNVQGNLNAQGNTAGGSGGAIFIALANGASTAFNAPLTLTGNSAGKNGGAIALLNSNIDSANTLTLNDNHAFGSAGNTSANMEYGGGAIYFEQGGSLRATSDATLNGNSASTSASHTCGALVGGTAVCTVRGGAIHASGNAGGGTVTFLGTATLDGNSATSTGADTTVAGGAIYARTLEFLGSTTQLNNNTAQATAGNAFGVGGAAYVLSTTTFSGNATLDNNRSISSGTGWAYGGAIYALGAVSFGGSATLNGNSATATQIGFALGGALLLDAGDLTITGVAELNGNAATSSAGSSAGGAIFVSNGGVFFQSDATLNGNSATTGGGGAPGEGGAIYAAAGIRIAGRATLDNNTVTVSSSGAAHGGAMSASGSIALGGPAELNGNSAVAMGSGPAQGGAIYLDAGDLSVSGAAEMNDNRATSNGGPGEGGAIYDGNGNLVFENAATFSGNQASRSGGAIYLASGNLALASAGGALTLRNNQAGTGDGGGIVVVGGKATLGNAGGAVTVENNSAPAGRGGAVFAGGDFSLVAGGPSTLAGNTAGTQGGAVWGGGNVTLEAAGGDLTVSGNRAGGLGGAIYMDPLTLTLNATGGDISFSDNLQNTAGTAQANAIYFDNVGGGGTVLLNPAAGRAITFFDPLQNNGANGLITVTQTGAGRVSFDGARHADPADRWSQVYANTRVAAGSFEVTNDAVYGARMADVGGTAPSSFTVDGGATLAGGVAGTVRADQFALGGNAVLDIAGRQGAARGVFTLDAASVNFGAGSALRFNTMLDDGSAQNTDRLVLSHAAVSGTGSLLVANANGPGGVTQGDGIELIRAVDGATTAADSFVLGARVASGAYEYLLFRGGAQAPDNWYLRSTFAGPPEPEPEPVLPNYRVEVPVDMALPAVASQLGLTTLGTYHDRIGEDHRDAAAGDAASDAPGAPVRRRDGWGRIFGQSNHVDRGGSDRSPAALYDTFNRNGPIYNADLGGAQAGMDLLRRGNADGSRDTAGAYLAAGWSSADVQGVYGGAAGTASTAGYSLGGYWTRKGASGGYLDGVAQLSWYDAEGKSVLGQKLATHGWGLAASIEGGYPFALGPNWRLEPQAQLIYQTVSLQDDADDFGQVGFDTSNTLYARVGVRLVRNWTQPDGLKMNAWARLDLWGAAGPDAHTTFASLDGQNPLTLDTSLGKRWAQLQLGVSGQISPTASVFVSTDYSSALDSSRVHGFGARLGARFVW